MSLSSSSAETAPVTYAHGMNSQIVVNGVAICITDFSFDRKQVKHDVTTTCNAGKNQYQGGLQTVDFTGKGFLDLTVSPFVNFVSGSSGSVVWSANGTTVNFSSAKCVFESVKITSTVKDVITFDFSGSGGADFIVA